MKPTTDMPEANHRITYLIHGNLQTPAVWDPLLPSLNLARPQLVSLAHTETSNMLDWAKNFCRRVTEETQGKPAFLIAYSLGGRLALHAILEAPHLWAGAVICGAHPGSDDLPQRAAWLNNDRLWAQRFLTEPWDNLISEWDAQAVFGGVSNPCPPQESDFQRKALARQFEHYSKGHQTYLLPLLRQASLPPVLVVSGQRDHTYTALGQQLAQAHPAIQHQALPNAAHRTPWEAPQAFADLVRNFFSRIP